MRNALIAARPRTVAHDLLDFDRFLNRVFDRFGNPAPQEYEERVWNPAIDIEEHDKGLTVRADVPGADPKEIKITVNDGYLSIEGEREDTREGEDGKTRWAERFSGSFSRSVRLPNDVDTGAVEAKYTHGVLEIDCPLKPESRPREIKVAVK